MGFDAWFFARLDYADKDKRKDEREMEFVWRPNPETFKNDTQIFTHALHSHYSAPDGFNFDMLADDPMWLDNNKSKDFNANQEAQKLMALLEERAQHYMTDEIFVVFGDDFQY